MFRVVFVRPNPVKRCKPPSLAHANPINSTADLPREKIT
jgi:hypothetical protein